MFSHYIALIPWQYNNFSLGYLKFPIKISIKYCHKATVIKRRIATDITNKALLKKRY